MAQRDEPADTALMFRRSEEGAACRDRAAAGTLTKEDEAALPSCVHELLPHLRSPVNSATGVAVKPADYVNMVDECIKNMKKKQVQIMLISNVWWLMPMMVQKHGGKVTMVLGEP